MANRGAAAINGLLFDLDGVLYVGDRLIPGAAEALQELQQHQLPQRFITNTSTQTVRDIAAKLQRLGLTIAPADIFSAVSATLSYLRQQGSPRVHLLLRDSVCSEFSEFEQQHPAPDYVVVGDIGAAWDYALLNRVFNELMGGAELIAMHANKYWQTEQGLQMDIGAFVAGLEFVTGKQATIIGKPSPDFFAAATAALQLPPQEVAIIGDDIENDVGGGQASGLQGILVRTGKYRQEVAEASTVTPDAILDSVADLPAFLQQRRH